MNSQSTSSEQVKNPKEHWDEKYAVKSDRGRWASGYRMQIYEWATEHLPNQELTLLDVGSGFGDGLRHLCNLNPKWKPTGMDYANTAVAEAVIPTIQFDLTSDREIPESFDVVISIQTLEHFPKPGPMIEKLLRAARKQVIITVPYQEDVSNHPEHEFSFDKAYFRKYGKPWFHVNGYRIKVVYGLSFASRCWQSAERWISPRQWIRRLKKLTKSAISR